MEYAMCTGADAEELMEKVNILLDQGWTLYGSPTIARCVVDGFLSTTLFGQAMTKE